MMIDLPCALTQIGNVLHKSDSDVKHNKEWIVDTKNVANTLATISL